MKLEELTNIRHRIDRLRSAVRNLVDTKARVSALESIRGENEPPKPGERERDSAVLFLGKLQDALRYQSELRYRVSPIVEKYMPLICAELRMQIEAEIIAARNERVILANTLRTYLPAETVEEIEDGTTRS